MLVRYLSLFFGDTLSMNVVDARDPHFFATLCKDLAKKAGSDYDLVVGIATGGVYVLNEMWETQDIPKLVVARQRVETQRRAKNEVLKWLVPRLPAWLQRKLRIIEIRIREARFHKEGREMPAEEIKITKGDLPSDKSNIKRILIVDDAIDTGSTMQQAIDFLSTIYPNATFYTGSISKTFKNSIVNPDFLIYDETIVQFPWALDARSVTQWKAQASLS